MNLIKSMVTALREQGSITASQKAARQFQQAMVAHGFRKVKDQAAFTRGDVTYAFHGARHKNITITRTKQ